MKFVLLFLALLAAAVVAQNHTVTFGSVGRFDTLLFKDSIAMESKWLRVVTQDVSYPPKGIVSKYNITAVRVVDMAKKGKGGYVTILSGGPGQRNVTLHLKSQRGEGFNFLLEIFGRQIFA